MEVSILIQKLLLINGTLGIKTRHNKVHEFLQDWIERSRNNRYFLERVAKELSDIGEGGLANQLLTRKSYDTVTDVTCAVPIDEEPINKEKLLSLSSNRKVEQLCKVLCLLSIAIFLLLALLLISLQTSFTLSVASVALKAREPVSKVVAENDTVSLVEVDKQSINSILISEVVKNGDHDHRITLALVPTSNLTFMTQLVTDSWNGSTIVPDLPIINEIYVYLNKGSGLSYNIQMGNSQNTGHTTLYVFDTESSYRDYFAYNVLDSPVFSQEISIGIKDEDMPLNHVTFTAPSDSYYFIVLLAPEENIIFSYKANATERVVDIKQYTLTYPSCVLDSNRNCTLSTSSLSSPASEILTLLAFTTPIHGFESKINHLRVSFTDRSYLMMVPSVVLGTTVCLTFIILLAIVSGIMWKKIRRNKRRYGYMTIN